MISKTRLSRRSLLAGASALALPSGLAKPAAAQEKVVRYGISMADIPLTSGQPDRGAGAYQFTGYTIYDALVKWEMDVAERPGTLVPGLATEWNVDDTDTKLWGFKLRPGVKFHDGSDFNADAVIWNLEKIFNKDFSPVRPAPGLAGPAAPAVDCELKKIDDTTVEIKTKAVDALFPYQMLWFLVASPANWEKLGKGARWRSEPSGTGPSRASPAWSARARRLVKNEGYFNPKRSPKTDQPGAGLRARGFQPHRRALSNSVECRDAAARCGGSAEAVGHAHRAERDAARLELPTPRCCRARRGPTSGCARPPTSRSTATPSSSFWAGSPSRALGQVDPSSPWFGKPTFVLKYAPDEARKLMSEAGFSKAQPLKTKFVVASGGTGQMLSLPMNEAIQEMFKDIYIDLEFKVVELEALYTAWRAGAKADITRT